ncbi:MAG: protease inhibitor I42 family protein [Dehalococcoidia bacterium]|nr:protease inhibitor I42 family protein [Dehalococcoidia bacterium]
MNTRLALILMLLASAVFAGTGCNFADRSDGKVAIEVTCDDFQKPGQRNVVREANAKVAQIVDVALCANASTGFQWEEAVIGDTGVVQQIDRQFEAPKAGMPGAPGNDRWSFKALKKGHSDISMRYSRPWEGGEKGVWTFTLKVFVE